MKINELLITPEIAKKYLESNLKNRNVKLPVLLRYANDMQNGKWKQQTGELIKISKSGIILDGQHRLLAVIKSNTPVLFHVATDLEDSVFDVLDTGSSRHAGDVFHINGIKNANCTPSMIQLYEILKMNIASEAKTVKLYKKHTNAGLLSLYNDRSLFWDNVSSKSLSWYNLFSKVLSPQLIGGMYAYFYDVSPFNAEDFMNQLCSGMGIKNATIAYTRNLLIKDRLAVKKMPADLKNIIIIKTWNYYRKGIEVKSVKHDLNNDPRPVAI